MKPLQLGLAYAAALATLLTVTQASAQGAKPGVERLYILNCGEGVAGDISRWSPGVNVGKTMDFVDNCYLIKHSQGWILWDTGLADAIAAMPEGQRPADPRMTHWRRPKKCLPRDSSNSACDPPTSNTSPSPTPIPTISAT